MPRRRVMHLLMFSSPQASLGQGRPGQAPRYLSAGRSAPPRPAPPSPAAGAPRHGHDGATVTEAQRWHGVYYTRDARPRAPDNAAIKPNQATLPVPCQSAAVRRVRRVVMATESLEAPISLRRRGWGRLSENEFIL